jgi:hypothetical protein
MFKIESNKQGLGLCDPPESYRAVVTTLSLLTSGDLADRFRDEVFGWGIGVMMFWLEYSKEKLEER